MDPPFRTGHLSRVIIGLFGPLGQKGSKRGQKGVPKQVKYGPWDPGDPSQGVIFDPLFGPPLEGSFELTGGSCGVLAQKGSKRGPNMGQNGPWDRSGDPSQGGSNMTPPGSKYGQKGPLGQEGPGIVSILGLNGTPFGPFWPYGQKGKKAKKGHF